MIRVLFPDPPIWQAGIEFGLHALSFVTRQGVPVSCVLRKDGPLIEAVGFAVKELGLTEVHYCEWKAVQGETYDIALLPRVQSMEQESIINLIDAGRTVIASDPEINKFAKNLRLFPRRDVEVLVKVFLEVCGK